MTIHAGVVSTSARKNFANALSAGGSFGGRRSRSRRAACERTAIDPIAVSFDRTVGRLLCPRFLCTRRRRDVTGGVAPCMQSAHAHEDAIVAHPTGYAKEISVMSVVSKRLRLAYEALVVALAMFACGGDDTTRGAAGQSGAAGASGSSTTSSSGASTSGMTSSGAGGSSTSGPAGSGGASTVGSGGAGTAGGGG